MFCQFAFTVVTAREVGADVTAPDDDEESEQATAMNLLPDGNGCPDEGKQHHGTDDAEDAIREIEALIATVAIERIRHDKQPQQAGDNQEPEQQGRVLHLASGFHHQQAKKGKGGIHQGKFPLPRPIPAQQIAPLAGGKCHQRQPEGIEPEGIGVEVDPKE